MVPTLVVYEQQSYNIPNLDQSETQINLTTDEWLMLYLHAEELESQETILINDETFVRE